MPINHNPYLEKLSPWSSHSQIVAILKSLPKKSRVLDIGTADGLLARLSKASEIDFYGIEPRSEWAKEAEKYYEAIWVGLIEDAPEVFLSNDYDAIVFADVLEHTTDPLSILVHLVSLQKPGCKIIISVPNIANLWVRLNLLFGRFDYTERGILDKTHLRFFTHKTLIKMVQQADLTIDCVKVTPIPLELVSNFFLSSTGAVVFLIFAALTKLFPTILGYQFIIQAKKHE